MNNTKKVFTITTTIMMLLITIYFTTATEWTRITPNPSGTTTINHVFSLSNNNLLLIGSDAGNCYLNNGSWQEINSPESVYTYLSSYTFRNVQKTNNGLVFYAYSLASNKTIQIIQYSSTTNQYSIIFSSDENFTDMANYGTFVCLENNNKCYLGTGYNDTDARVYQIYPSYSLYLNTPSYLTYGTRLIDSNSELCGKPMQGASSSMRRWSGVSWYDTNSADLPYKNYVISSSQKILTGGGGTNSISWYNTTNTNYYWSGVTGSVTQSLGEYIDGYLHYRNTNTTAIYKIIYGARNNTNVTLQFTADETIIAIDYDTTTEIGIMAGINGVAYIYNETGTPTYTVTPRINSPTTNYGSQVIFYGKPYSSIGGTANLTLEIWDTNFTSLFYTTTVNNLPNGIETELYRINTDSIGWLTFPLGEYVYNLQADWNTQSLSNSTSWIVTQGELQNITTYKVNCYNEAPPTGISGIYTITKYDENNIFSSIKDSSNNLYLASFDITNPSNIIYRALYTNSTGDPDEIITSRALNKQSGRNGNPSVINKVSMDEGGDKIYVATNDDLFTYNNTQTMDARELIYEYDKGLGILENDGISDVSAQSDLHAWVCQDGTGLEDDDIYGYNTTEQDFDNKMNMNPCISLIYDTYIFAHRGGSNDIQIWEATTQTKLSTIDITTSISTYSYNDLIDYISPNLFIIAGKNEAKKYDTTNKSNPIIKAKCLTTTSTTEIVSIEAISSNELLIGTIDTSNGDDIIYICDFNNNDTFNATRGGYIAQYLIGTYNREWQIIKNDNNGKFSIAEDDMLEVCYYEATNETITINQEPTIDDYTFTPDTDLCLNQQVNIEIIASDPNSEDYLQYGVSCSGGGNPTNWQSSNLITCSYSTTGTKTLTIQVKDNWGAVSDAVYNTITVNNCNVSTATTIYFKIIDGETANPITGGLVGIYDEETLIEQKTTDSNGYADFSGITNYKIYRGTFTADEYAPKTEYFYPSYTRYTRTLEKLTTETGIRTLLMVTVTDNNNQPLENSLVATLNPITGSSKYGLTDYTGTTYLFDVEPSTKMIVGAKKEGYTTTSTYISLGEGEQKSITIIMGVTTAGTGIFPTTNRTCADTIAGVILCGNLSTTGTGSSCTKDNDCISGRCSLAISQNARTCSTFNYTLCDAQGINRGNTCIFRNVSIGILKGIGNFILDYFLYVLIIVLLIVGALIIRRSLSH